MKKQIFIIGLMVMGAISSQAQYDQEIISVGDRTLTVDQAFKISDLPSTVDTVPRSYDLNYVLMPRQIEVSYEPKQIKAAKLKVVEPLPKLYRGFVKAGIGVYATPMLEVDYSSIRNRDWAYGIKARHFSSQGGLKDVADNAYGENHIGAWAKRYINKHTVEAGLGYDLDKIHYYGFNPGDAEISPKDYQQSYNTIKGYVEMKSHYSDSSKVQHNAFVKIRNFQGEIEASETNVVIGGGAAKTIDDYRFALDMSLDVNSLTQGRIKPFSVTDFQQLTEGLGEVKGTIFRMEPSIHARKGDLTADIGLGLAVDAVDPQTKWHMYPQAYLSYSLFDDLFTPYAGITGELKRNSYHSLANENPYIHNVFNLLNTSKDLELYAGIRGTVLDNLAFNAKVSVESYSDYAFFISDTLFSVENKFRTDYDDLRVIRLAGELTYMHDEHLTIAGRLELASNSADDFKEAYNLPSVKFNVDARYDLDNQFIVKAQIFAAGKRYGATMVPQEGDEVFSDTYYAVPLRGYVDGSFGVEYRYTKRISAFFDINNLTGGRYERWNKYPTQPVLIMGGLTYSF